MARRCELSGKAVLTGNNVSHAKRRTKRRFLPNLCNVTLESEALKKRVRLTISAHALRSVEHRGGLDAYLLKAGDEELSLKRPPDEARNARSTGRKLPPRRLGGLQPNISVMAGLDPAIHVLLRKSGGLARGVHDGASLQTEQLRRISVGQRELHDQRPLQRG